MMIILFFNLVEVVSRTPFSILVHAQQIVLIGHLGLEVELCITRYRPKVLDFLEHEIMDSMTKPSSTRNFKAKRLLEKRA
jgi:hypothetical protein